MKKFTVLPLLVLSSLLSCKTLNPLMPDKRPEGRLPEAPDSFISLNIAIDNDLISETIEKGLDKKFTGNGKGEKSVSAGMISQSIKYNWDYNLARENINYSAKDNVITVTTNVKGRLNADSQGTKGYADVVAAAGFRIMTKLDRNWNLVTKTEPVLNIIKADVPVGVKAAGQNIKFTVSIKDELDKKIRPKLIEAGIKIDQRLKEYDFRQLALKAWESQQKSTVEVSSDPKITLKVVPDMAYFSGIRTDNKKNIYFGAGVRCKIITIIGSYKDDGRVAGLPELEYKNVNGEASIQMPVVLNYKELSDRVKKKIVNSEFPIGDKIKVSITDIDLYGNGNYVNVILGIKVKNAPGALLFSGKLYMAGKPVFHKDKKVMEVEDFDYDIRTKNLLVNAADWLLHKPFLEFVRKKLHWNYESNVNLAVKNFNSKMTEKKLADKIYFKSQMDSLTLGDVIVNPGYLGVMALMKGKAEIEMR